MTNCEPSNDLIIGSAVFSQPALQQQAQQSARTAWRRALATNPAEVLQGVSGPFAVAVRLDDGRCVMAVDRFARETLCYRVTPEGLRFAAGADEIADGCTIDPQAIFDYLYFHCIPSPRTIFEGVYRLPAGHFAVYEDGRLEVQPYWTPEFSVSESIDFSSARTAFLGLVEGAVSAQLDGSKPACFLSGGTDSSTVAGMLSKVSSVRPATYSIGFDAKGYDEMAYARLAAKHFGTEHHEIYFTPQDLVANIPKVAAFYDQPFGNSSALPAFHCARIAASDGVSRILAGDGGDELFGGNSRYAKQRIFGWWKSVPPLLRDGLIQPLAMSRVASSLPGMRKLHSYVEQARIDMPGRLQMYNLLMRLGIHDVLEPGFLASVNVGSPLAQQQAVWDSVPPGTSELNTTLAFDWRYTLAESDLPKVRETTRLAGISVGFPMLDSGLVDFSLSLPDSFKLRGLKLRWFFKEALRGFLPDDILTKKKQGFGLPFGVWLMQVPELKALAEDSLGTLASRGIVRPAFIRQLMDHRMAEHPGYFGEQVWILMMLEQWLRAKAPEFRHGGGRGL